MLAFFLGGLLTVLAVPLASVCIIMEDVSSANLILGHKAYARAQARCSQTSGAASEWTLLGKVAGS